VLRLRPLRLRHWPVAPRRRRRELEINRAARALNSSCNTGSLKMDDYTESNRVFWNARTAINANRYDIAGFKAGKSMLTPLVREELGDVAGKSLLHLQCGLALDTLSWARLGARVTGVDLSEDAIALAQALSREVGLDARFVCTDIYQLPQVL